MFSSAHQANRMKQTVAPESCSRITWFEGKVWIIVGLGRGAIFLIKSPVVFSPDTVA